ncbi:hypothetical protein ACMGDH_02190 [Sphingomonas sp. DT-207]|uniref:hypothetical protein n=1 Tax=Sphingomonas sp. DT-207 TaxID=3396167 RepID=UPI003F1D9367
MLRKNLGSKIVANAAGLLASTVALSSIAAPATANPACVEYARAVCLQWDALGYADLQDCRLAEYDICVAGGAAAPRAFSADFLKFYS